MEWVYKDGLLCRVDEACLGVHDGAVLYGASLFETLRCYRGHPFRLEAHLHRLRRWTEQLRLFAQARAHLDLNPSTLLHAIHQLLHANRLTNTDTRLRITVTAGSKHCLPTCFLLASPISAEQEETWKRGIGAVLLPDPRSVDAEVPKWGSYAWHIEAQLEAQARGADEAIWFRREGTITEGAVSNVFVWHENLLRTPPLQEGILAGITRQVVFEIADRLNIDYREERLPIHILRQAQAVMLTNSVREIVPVTHLDGTPLPLHPIISQIQHAYRQLVHEELSLQ